MQPPYTEMIFDGEDDISEEVVIYSGNCDQCHLRWDNGSVSVVPVDDRGQFSQTESRLKQYSRVYFFTPMCLF